MPTYPISRPTTGNDGRFTIGLAIDVAAVLHQHGYPPITTGGDLVRLQTALFNLIYHQETR